MRIAFLPEITKEINKVILVNLVITLVFFSLVIPGIVWDRNNTFQARDQNNYHLRQVETFVQQPLTWNHNYPSSTATTPGHHLALSWVAKYFAGGEVNRLVFPIRIANALFSLALLLTGWWLIYSGGNKNIVESTYLLLPLLFSYQFLGSAIWVMTDNAAALWTCLSLWLLIPRQTNSGFNLTLAGIFAALAVLWRQTYIWLVVPIFFRLVNLSRGNRNWWLYLTSLLPPLLVLGYFCYLWHGTTPSEFQGERPPAFNLAVPTYIISLFGTFGLFYLGYLSSELKKIRERQVIWLICISLIVGFIIAMLFPTSYAPELGRRGGLLWELAKKLPNIYDRSLLFLVLCPLGTVLISLWCKATIQHQNQNERLIFISILAWIAANTVSIVAFQRYYEVLLLIILAWLASLQSEHFRRSHIGVLILTGLMSVMSLQQIVFGF